MSLTVATSSVDLSWQEIDTVDFTAGTVATMDAMVTEVQDNLKRGTLDATTTPTKTQVQRWLIRGKEYFAALKNFQESLRYAYATTTAGTYEYSLPPDFRGGEVILRDVTSSDQPRKLYILTAKVFDARYPNPGYSGFSSTRPYIVCIKGRKLILHRPADDEYTLELQYSRSGDDITNTDVSWIPEVYRFMICDYAIYRSFMSLHQWDAANLFKQEWMEGIGLARKSDGKHKWSATNFQCNSWL